MTSSNYAYDISSFSAFSAHAATLNAHSDTWMCDSACNIVCCDENDPSIIKWIPSDEKWVRHLSGVTQAKACLVRTPLGNFEGLAGAGFRRLLPQFLIAREGSFTWDKEGPRGIFRGKQLDFDLVANIPRLYDRDYSVGSQDFMVRNRKRVKRVLDDSQNFSFCTLSHEFNTHEKSKQNRNEHESQVAPKSDTYMDSVFKPSKFFISHDLSPNFEHFLDGKQTVYFNHNHKNFLDEILKISVQDTSLEKFLELSHGYSVAPIMAVRHFNGGRACGPFAISKRKQSKLDAVANKCTPLRLSITTDTNGNNNIVVTDWRDTDVKFAGDTIHIFMQPTVMPSRRGDECGLVFAVDAKFQDELTDAAKSLVEDLDLLEQDKNGIGEYKKLDDSVCEEHAKTSHDKFDPKCIHCVRSALRSRQHRRRKNGPVRVGKLHCDVQLWSKAGPYVLVAACTAKDGSTVVIAEPFHNKTTKAIRRALAAAIAQAQFEWNAGVLDKVMSDREKGLQACADDFNELGVLVQLTQGSDPQANGRAESVGNLLCCASRVRLQDFQPNARKKLWPAAMVHSAMSLSYKNKKDKTELPSNFAILPFASRVEVRHPPLKKLHKDEHRTFYGCYLHPSWRTPNGHLVLRLDEQTETVLGTHIGVTMVAHDGNMTKTSELNKKLKFGQGRNKFPSERLVTSVSADHPEQTEQRDENPEPPVRRSARIAAKNNSNNLNANLSQNQSQKSNDPNSFCVPDNEYYEACASILNDGILDTEIFETDDMDSDILNDAAACDYEFEDIDTFSSEELDQLAFVTRLCERHEHFTEAGQAATQKELASLLANSVLGDPIEERDVPVGSEVGTLANILSQKEVETKQPEYKARVIYLGNQPRIKTEKGIKRMEVPEEDDVWVSSSADHSAVRMCLAWALVNNKKTFSCDLKSAYLQARAGGRTTFCRVPMQLRTALPEDIRIKAEKMKRPVFPLLRALYGRVRSGRDWATLLETTLKNMGFKRSLASRGLYHCSNFQNMGPVTLCCYVDDLVVAASPEVAAKFFGKLEETLVLKTQPDGKKYVETNRFLGIEYEHTEDAEFRYIKIHMPGYVDKVVADYESLTHHKIRPRHTLPKEPIKGSGKGYDSRPLVGSLLWLTRCFRPDVGRCVGVLGSSIESWDSQHHVDFERAVLGMIEATKDSQLVMQFHKDDRPQDLRLETHSDASLAAPRSISGSYTFLASDRGSHIPLSWKSKRQGLATTSSASAEYIALSLATEATMPIQDTLVELGVLSASQTPILSCDNRAVLLGLTRGFSSYDSVTSKASALRICQLHDMQNKNLIKYQFVPTGDNRADSLTKILGSAAAFRHARLLFNLT